MLEASRLLLWTAWIAFTFTGFFGLLEIVSDITRINLTPTVNFIVFVALYPTTFLVFTRSLLKLAELDQAITFNKEKLKNNLSHYELVSVISSDRRSRKAHLNALVPLIILMTIGVIYWIVFGVFSYRSFFSQIWILFIDIILHYKLEIPLTFATSLLSIYLAYAAYILRCRDRVTYGFVEVVFGIGNIVYSVIVVANNIFARPSSFPDPRQFLIQFVAGLYIVVRGLVNIHDSAGTMELSMGAMLHMSLKSLRASPRRLFSERGKGVSEAGSIGRREPARQNQNQQ